ncbi:hypothetical protein MMC21_000450 [Puttea exsequens]|nr:hypothetical protein [Puttea exsequens]
MLRRKPTAITLTTEDIAAYEDHCAAERNRKENAPTSKNPFDTPRQTDGKVDPNDELKPLPGDRARVRGAGVGSAGMREERIMGR